MGRSLLISKIENYNGKKTTIKRIWKIFSKQTWRLFDERNCFFDKKILLQLGLAAAASASDAEIQNKRLDQDFLMKW